MAFSPDGKIIASCGDDKTIRLWNVTTGEPIGQPLKGHTSIVRTVVFSPDGKILASCGDDKTIRLWNVAMGEPICHPLRAT
jgi:WD40 repeat protein